MVVGIEPKWRHVCHLGGGGCVSMGSFKLNGFTFRGPRSQQLPCCPWALGHLGSALPA